MSGHIDAERILDAFLAPEPERLADRVIDAALADIARTPQRRALRVPWRYPNVSNLSSFARAVIAGAVLLGAAIGGSLLITGNAPAPGPTQTPDSSPLPSGISGWTTYTSSVYGVTLGYPADWSVRAPATRAWQAADSFPAEDLSYADTFVSPAKGDSQIGLLAWRMPAGVGAHLDSTEAIEAWAEGFCRDIGAPLCETFTQAAVPMIQTEAGQYQSAILVPTARHQYAFLAECNSCLITSAADWVTVVVIAREDGFAPAARYGGSVELLKAVLSTMHVFLRGTS